MNQQGSKFRWLVLFSVVFTYVFMSSQRTAPGLITDQLMVDFQVTAVTIGLVTSIQFFVYTGLQIPMGLLADRYGPNFFLITGAFITGVGTIIYSLSSHEYVLFFARILTGIGDATIWVNMVLILGLWFTRQEFTRLIGVVAMSGSFGFLLATFPFALLIDLLGWRGAFLASGILLCLSSVLLYFVLVKKPGHSLFAKKNVGAEKTFTLLSRVFSSRQAWALFFCHFGIVGTYVGFISSWGVPFGIAVYDLTRTSASQLMMLGLLGALIGAPLASYVASRIGMIKGPYILVHAVLIASWSVFLLFQGQPPFNLLLVLFFVIGLAYGANALTFAAVRQTFPLKESGLVSGFANTGGFLSAVLLPSIFGKILDYFEAASGSLVGGYYYGFITPFIFSIIGFVGVCMLKEKNL